MISSVLKDLAAAIGPVLHLETLQLYICASDRATAEQSPVTIFELAPKLCVVDLLPRTINVIHAPWRQLTDLRADHCRDDRCLDVLSCLPNLVSFGVGLVDVRGISLERRPVVQLCQLTKLTVRTSEDPGPSFDHLLLPALRDFECVTKLHWSGERVPKIQNVIYLLSRSSCSLRKLEIWIDGIRDPNYLQILVISSSLV